MIGARRTAAVALTLLACGGDPTTSIDAGDPIDAALDAPGCDPTRPRSAAPMTVIGPASYEDRVLAVIGSATRSIDVQMYSFTSTRVADALIAADTPSLPVRVLLDGGQTENANIRTRLTNGGVEVRNAPAGFVNAHAKYLVVDDTRALIASGNFTLAGLNDQRNYVVEDRDPDDVADLGAIFEADWTGQTASLSCTRLAVTPGEGRLRIQTLIAEARTSLDVALYYLSDTAIRSALITAKNRGVAVRVLLAATSEIPDNGATATTLTNAGIPVRTLANPTMHAKIIVADGTAALVGSHNMSVTSLRDNREVGLIVRESGAVAPVVSQFGADWNAATPWP